MAVEASIGGQTLAAARNLDASKITYKRVIVQQYASASTPETINISFDANNALVGTTGINYSGKLLMLDIEVYYEGNLISKDNFVCIKFN